MKKTIGALSLALGVQALGTGAVQAADLSVTITNLTHGVYLTPLLVAAHDSDSHVFETGTTASASLQAMAECGDISGLVTELNTVAADILENPANGLLAPGASATATLQTGAGNDYLSVVAMLLPTNDGFAGLDAQAIPTEAGTYTYYLNAYDAGTEANSELLDSSGCAAGMAGIPAAPGGDAGSGGSGVSTVDSNATVHVHRGTLGDSNPTGGTSDLDSSIHRWQNPVLKLEVTVQ